MRRWSVLFLALITLSPFAAAAADSSYASDLLQLLWSQQKPLEYSMQASGHMEDTYLSVWASGNSEGSWSDPSSIRSIGKATVDVAWPGGKVRVKTQTRMVESTLYVWVEKIDGTYNDDSMRMGGQLELKKWIAIPLDDYAGSVSALGEEDFSAMFGWLDDLSNVRATQTQAGMTYEVTLTREAIRSVLQSLRQQGWDATTDEGVERLIRHTPPAFSFLFKIDTNRDFEVLSTRTTLHLSHPRMGASLEAHSYRRTSPVYATVPAHVMSLEDLPSAGKFSDIPGIDAIPFLINDDIGNDDWEDEIEWEEEWEDEIEWEEEWEDEIDGEEEIWEEEEWLEEAAEEDAEWAEEEPQSASEFDAKEPLPLCPPDAGAGAVRRGLCVYPRR
ncbi:MAG: hypothetical protein PHW10_05345 [Candidatus Peribacteraceae bacterium]|nr:hypothetical protein [Candidatus Peribacteraceae bacterium]